MEAFSWNYKPLFCIFFVLCSHKITIIESILMVKISVGTGCCFFFTLYFYAETLQTCVFISLLYFLWSTFLYWLHFVFSTLVILNKGKLSTGKHFENFIVFHATLFNFNCNLRNSCKTFTRLKDLHDCVNKYVVHWTVLRSFVLS